MKMKLKVKAYSQLFIFNVKPFLDQSEPEKYISNYKYIIYLLKIKQKIKKKRSL
jgi:hypothetical protein